MGRLRWIAALAVVALVTGNFLGWDDAVVVLVVAGLVSFTMSTYYRHRRFEGQVDQRNRRRYDDGFRERHGGGEDSRY
jgi:hypothetical protein